MHKGSGPPTFLPAGATDKTVRTPDGKILVTVEIKPKDALRLSAVYNYKPALHEEDKTAMQVDFSCVVSPSGFLLKFLRFSTQRHVEQIYGYMLNVARDRGLPQMYGILCSDVEYSFTKVEVATETLLFSTPLKVHMQSYMRELQTSGNGP